MGARDTTLRACDIQKGRYLQSPQFELSRCSVFNPVLSRTRSRMNWWLRWLPPSLHVTLVPIIKHWKHCSKGQSFVWAQPTSVRLMSWFLSWMKGWGWNWRASGCTDFRKEAGLGQGGSSIKKEYLGLNFLVEPSVLDLPTYVIRHISIYRNTTSCSWSFWSSALPRCLVGFANPISWGYWTGTDCCQEKNENKVGCFASFSSFWCLAFAFKQVPIPWWFFRDWQVPLFHNGFVFYNQGIQHTHWCQELISNHLITVVCIMDCTTIFWKYIWSCLNSIRDVTLNPFPEAFQTHWGFTSR